MKKDIMYRKGMSTSITLVITIVVALMVVLVITAIFGANTGNAETFAQNNTETEFVPW